ncbi:MAG TPA: glycosyltransferase [Thermodesulfobacteriota bacterium]|nr:glycosyltransferase [Thermodesulfobacteriota bacterium]
MKVMQVIASMDKADGGAVQVVTELTRALAKKGIGITIFAPSHDDHEGDAITIKNVEVRLFKKGFFSKHWGGYAPSLGRALRNEAAHFDLIHLHGLWYYPLYAAYRAATLNRIPYLVTVHGELAKQALQRRAFKKRIYSALIQKKILKEAHAIHALSPMEARDISRFVRNPDAVIIPNGITIEEFRGGFDSQWIKNVYPQIKDKKIILFLGRVAEEKGLETLSQAFSIMTRKRSDVCLLIVGPDKWGYKATLEKLLKREGIMDKVIFTGMLTGDQKRSALGCANVFVLPSHSEGFGVAVLEAMLSGLPVVISRQCGFKEVEKINAGRIVDIDAMTISKTLVELLDNPRACKEMGERGKRFIEKRGYSWDSIGEKILSVYKKIVNH